ncbi:MAG: hypothetical protein ABI743_14815, partial [bacterium]
PVMVLLARLPDDADRAAVDQRVQARIARDQAQWPGHVAYRQVNNWLVIAGGELSPEALNAVLDRSQKRLTEKGDHHGERGQTPLP